MLSHKNSKTHTGGKTKSLKKSINKKWSHKPPYPRAWWKKQVNGFVKNNRDTWLWGLQGKHCSRVQGSYRNYLFPGSHQMALLHWWHLEHLVLPDLTGEAEATNPVGIQAWKGLEVTTITWNCTQRPTGARATYVITLWNEGTTLRNMMQAHITIRPTAFWTNCSIQVV